MPKGTEDHVGFFWPQSKHIYSVSTEQAKARTNMTTDPVCWLGLELFKKLLRLGLRSTHYYNQIGRTEKKAILVIDIGVVEAGIWMKLFAPLVGSLFVTRSQFVLAKSKILPSIDTGGQPHLLLVL